VFLDLGSQVGTSGLAPVALGQYIWIEKAPSLRVKHAPNRRTPEVMR
jgi:hypothetical protein